MSVEQSVSSNPIDPKSFYRASSRASASEAELSTLTAITTSPESTPQLLYPSTADTEGETKAKRIVEVVVPRLTDEQRENAKRIGDIFLASDDEAYLESAIDKVVGEYTEGQFGWYYARVKSGSIHRYSKKRFEKHFPHLVSTYLRRKKKGDFAHFDPSSRDIHEDSRIKMTISLGKLTRKAKGERESSPIVIPDSEEEEEEWEKDVPEASDPVDDDEDMEDDGDDAYEEEEEGPVRRSTRAAAGLANLRNKKSAQELPFSPRRRNPGRKIRAVDSDDEDESEEGTPTPAASTRRSTRARKTTRANVADEDYEMDEEGEESEEYGSYKPRAPPPKKKKIVRGRASRAAYGNFRQVIELSFDREEDPETVHLRAHRDACQKCHRGPANVLIEKAQKRNQQRKRKGSSKRKKRDEDEEDSDNEEQLAELGGWVRCLKCPVSAHWRCLASTQQMEILKAAQERDWEEAKRVRRDNSGPSDGAQPFVPKPRKRDGLDAYQTTEFICSGCMKGGVCMNCLDVVLEPEALPQLKSDQDQTSVIASTSRLGSSAPEQANEANNELLFRCQTCKRLSHYAHLPVPDGMDLDPDDDEDKALLAQYYQKENSWLCSDCISYIHIVDKILAWRPYPANATEPSRAPGEIPDPKRQLPREYLVKWQDRSYRRVEWVPHGWLAAKYMSRLRNFLAGKAPVGFLLKQAVKEEEEANASAEGGVGGAGEDEDSMARLEDEDSYSMDPKPDADRRIPPAWKTVDRVLDVVMWCPHKARKKKTIPAGKGKKRSRIITDDEESMDEFAKTDWERAFKYGEQPDSRYTETLDEWLEREGTFLTEDDIEHVVYAFIKWDDLGYDEATWDSPPRKGEPGYSAFQSAFTRLVQSQHVSINKLSRAGYAEYDARRKGEYRRKFALKDDTQPDLGQSPDLKLMDFQIDGFNWLCNNWYNLQPCILADDMGLGKTVQIATFVGKIAKQWSAYPVLVVVPNSTITNWLREFARWAPGLRVVPFYGEAKGREIIKRYELRHSQPTAGTSGLKFHVLVTTYDNVSGSKDFTSVFKNVDRWEALIVDEGQRLKNDGSLLFKKLNELNTIHRIIMTGTPLNNNMRELFNLMNFLDPDQWNDLAALEKEYDQENLNEESVKALHERLRPYFLRRVKAEVLKLPPKNEVIVPLSLTPLQKELYKSVLSKNVTLLTSLTRSLGQSVKGASNKSNITNILMELRKCIQHPYLLSPDIEPRGLSQQETHKRLIAASAKLRLLEVLLPKLKARGHRVLLFSQFVIALDIIEDFINGEGFKYLRLDGNTKQADRQKGMDEFNRPNSDVFIYLLSTRAGGVGINLWSADTVIIFDPDFNPHQDLQAIARSHRYGQTKPCLVFKLMAKDTAEERIVQNGKKKLILDHVIVQKMDDKETGEDVSSILTHGARALFEEGEGAKDITYSENDVDNLISKTESETTQEEQGSSAMTFSFAKVWAADKDGLEEMADEDADTEQADSWAQTLKRIEDERAKLQAMDVTIGGRPARRAAAMAVKPQQSIDLGDTPKKKTNGQKRKRSKSTISDESEGFKGSVASAISDGDTTDSGVVDEFIPRTKKAARPSTDASSPHPVVQGSNASGSEAFCSICNSIHSGPCNMTDNPENLAAYRLALLTRADNEPIEEKREAIALIETVLRDRGELHLIDGQPLHLVERPPPATVSVEQANDTSMLHPRPSAQPPVAPAASSSKSAPGKHVSAPDGSSSSSAAARPAPSFMSRFRADLSAKPSKPKPKPKPALSASAPVQKGVNGTVSNAAASSSSAAGRPQPLFSSVNALKSQMTPISKVTPSKPTVSKQSTLNTVNGNKPSTAPKLPSATPNVPSSSSAGLAGMKRPVAPSTADESNPPKKAKSIPLKEGCAVCGREFHLLKDCPIVAAGPKSISQAIQSMEAQPRHTKTVQSLRVLLQQQKRRELANSGGM